MRINGNTPLEELCHSDDELAHFKYVKRVWKNGKWKYYYDLESQVNDISTAIGTKQLKEYGKASIESMKANRRKADAVSDAVETSKKLSQKKKSSDWAKKTLRLYDDASPIKTTPKPDYDKIETEQEKRERVKIEEQHRKNMAEMSKSFKEASAAGEARIKAYEDYIGTPISFITHPSPAMKKVMKRGKARLDRFFNR